MEMIALPPRRVAALVTAGVLAAATCATVTGQPTAHAALYYGSIAYSRNGTNAQVWNYPSRADAEQIAVKYCGYTDCTVLTSFTDCGAVADDGRSYFGGHGPTLAAASAAARANLGGGWIDSWACNAQ